MDPSIKICHPDQYYSEIMTKYRQRQCTDSANQWIYKIIDNSHSSDETIIYRTDQWCLCEDRHTGSDLRYLVIFADKTLQTIRDLRRRHVHMLREIQDFLVEWGAKTENMLNSHVYFHYMPSVFQLHLHVVSGFSMKSTYRAQPLQCVIRNLCQNSNHYMNALILTRNCKNWKRYETLSNYKTVI